ncbi:glycosyltransferase family 4 protein [Falsiroseomonas sp. CW058]|uniref:glycosyltransferase family 4 protein n=1 Tax=Falsiroseomonas sp. CW058 TaxID=3388664 RepID=UPI003D3107A9
MLRPRIAIDGYNLALEQGTGIATYGRVLSQRLGALGAEVGVLWGQRGASGRDELLREIMLLDARPPKTPWLQGAVFDLRAKLRLRLGATAVPVPVTGRVIRRGMEARTPHADRMWNIPDLYRAAAINYGVGGRFAEVTLPDAPEVMHWTYPLPIRVKGARNIYTIHDLVPLRLPYATLDVKRRILGTLRGIAAKADHIVTVSEASKRDIVELLGVPEDRVTNTWQSVELPAQLTDMPEAMARGAVEGSFGLPWGDYWLFYGAIEPKKNLGRLIEAYLASGSALPLVIVGKQAWRVRQELGLIYADDGRILGEADAGDGTQVFSRRLRDRVVLLDYAPFRLLVSLIRGARGVLFPSLYEGFGLPVLEAMSLGAPVVTSNVASLPEVVGDAAVLVDPYDVRAMAEAIRAVETHPGLRAEMAARGPRRAALFGTEAYDRRLAEMYAKVGVRFPQVPEGA